MALRIADLRRKLRHLGPAFDAPVFGRDGVDVASLASGSVLVGKHFLLTALFLAFGAGVLAKLLVPPKFEARTAFVTEGSRTTRLPSGLAGIAGQFGLDLSGQAERSPRFYAALARSSAILGRLLAHNFAVPSKRPRNPWKSAPQPGDSSAPLAVLLLGRRPDTPGDTLRARRKLEDALSARVDDRTGIVELRVRSRDRWLAAHMANDLVVTIDTFNATMRRTSGSLERQFLERQVQGARDSLQVTEQNLERFYEANRNWHDAPRLVFRESTLRRRANMAQDLYLNLSHQLEEARLQEVNDMPVITQIEVARPPEKPMSPKPTLIGLVVGLVTLLLPVTLWIVETALSEHTERLPSAPDRSIDEVPSITRG